MPKEVKQPVLRPTFEFERDEVLQMIEQATGQKPKPGSHSVTMIMKPDGETAVLTWVDAEERVLLNPIPQTEKPKPNGPNPPSK